MTNSETSHLYAVILAGGSGTRLWPLSTQKTPKQFLAMGEAGSFLQETSRRLTPLIEAKNQWVVCGKSHAAEVSRHLPDLPLAQILAEPCPRNTAAAIALAATHLRARDPQAVMIVLPADHWIDMQDRELFQKNLKTAAKLAVQNQVLVTLGIRPDLASTAYGYLERGEALNLDEEKVFRVKAFHEKPDLKTAERYLSTSNYFWNSGMFVWTASLFLEELQHYLPATAQAFTSLSLKLSEPDYEIFASQLFQNLENISVDYALMEKSKKVYMIASEFGWDDIGSLDSFEKLLTHDADHNCSQGKTFAIASKNNLVISQSKPIILMGVENLAVIEGKEATLILPKQLAQDVKKVVEYLKSIGQKDLL